MHTPGAGSTGFVFLFLVQILFCIIFCVYTQYGEELLPGYDSSKVDNFDGKHVPSYPHFQDIHVMIFVGFGFLMTFLKKYGYSATGLNLFLAALIVQWAMIARGIFDLEDGHIHLSLDDMIGADIAAAAVLISMGALLGRTTPIQLLIMGLFEIIAFAANEHFQIELMKITDAGGSITVHAFGAYFGLAVSFVLRPKPDENGAGVHEGASYTSDIFAMIGTLFLWIFWPSFNSALLDGADQERAILNTYLAIAAAAVSAFLVSALVCHERKFDMVHVQNSTLAGGVAVGSVCNLLINPHGAILIGILAGILSVVGYKYLSPSLTSGIRLHDTCGVNNLHGMPAIMSALFSAIYATFARPDAYKDSLTDIFPAMMNATAIDKSTAEYVIGGYGRTAAMQGGFQLLGILSTLLVAIVSGLITGLILKSPNIRSLTKADHHKDDVHWEVAEA